MIKNIFPSLKLSLLISSFLFLSCEKSLQVQDETPLTAGSKNLASVSAVGPKIILKLDDYGTNTSFKTAPLDMVIQKKVKATIGVIADRLATNALTVYGSYINAVDAQGKKRFEVWHHGLDHSDNNLPDSNFEFDGTSYDFQKSHFETANQLVIDRLSVQMRSFGAPYNQNDANTNKVVGENLNYKVFMFSSPSPYNVMSLNQRVNMETGTGVLDYDYLVANFNSKKSTYPNYMVLQGHPNKWTAAMVTEFGQIIDFLLAQGCEFVLPYEYYQSVVTTLKATVYKDCSYAGTSASLAIGSYTAAQLAALGITNNSISSIKVPAGLKVTAYKDDNFTGVLQVITTNHSCLTDLNFNDDISSLKVAVR